jgi:hypothetical protein
MGSVEKIFSGRRTGGDIAYSERARFMLYRTGGRRIVRVYNTASPAMEVIF